MDNCELEVAGCRTFACPSLSLIDEKGKELGLRDSTIKRAKEMAIEYVRKTYRQPRYSSSKFLMPSFLYIASVLEGEKRHKKSVTDVFGMSSSIMKRWCKDIIDELCIKVTDNGRELVPDEPVKYVPAKYSLPDLSSIEIYGKSIGLKDKTIEKAKELAVVYFEAIYATYGSCSYSDVIFPVLIYVASIIEGDRRISQNNIAVRFHTNSTMVSALVVNVMDVLRLNAVRRGDNYIESISE